MSIAVKENAMENEQSAPLSVTQLRRARAAGQVLCEADLARIRAYDNECQKKKTRLDRAKTDAGRQMPGSEIVVKPADADEILKERGLHDVHSRSAHIRDTVYWLATQTAEHLGLPGPNWYLLRYGYFATKAAMADPDFVPVEIAGQLRAAGDEPDDDPPGELCTYLELASMMEMQGWQDWSWIEEFRRKEADAAAASILERHPVDDWAAWAIVMGEALPGVEATTAKQLVATTRLFARALGGSEPREGESCRQYTSRVYDAWRLRGHPPLHSLLLRLDEGAVEKPDFGGVDDYMVWPPDADAPIEIAKLPALPAIPEGDCS
jgi:hypothetical protein